MRRHATSRQLLLAILLVLGLALPDVSTAAVPPASGADTVLEEVLVTARRREEAAVAVPVTLTYIDGATLDALQFRDIEQFAGLSSGVEVYGGGDGVSTQLTIRGVVSPGSLVEPGNAVYIDEAYASGMYTILPPFYDIASVQVLKGPQAGLYGRNTTGGAVLVTTAPPTGELSGRLDGSYEEYDEYDTNGTVNVPVSDTFRVRATGWYSDRDGGYYQNGVLDENLDTARQRGGRLTLAALPGDRVSMSVTGEYTDMDFGPGAAVAEGVQTGPPPLAPESRHNVLRDDPGRTEQDFARVTGRFEMDIGFGTAVVVGGWRRVSVREPGTDYDATAYTAIPTDPLSALDTPAPMIFTLDGRDTSRVVDLQFRTPDDGNALRAVFGVTYYEETLRFDDAVMPVRELAQALAVIGLEGNFEHHVDQKTRSRAGFGEFIWTPLQQVELTADLRYTRDRKDMDSSQEASGLSDLLRFPDLALDTDKTFDNWSPGITLAYKPDDTSILFAKYVQGFRAGGFNTLAYTADLLPYDSEESENYELGYKGLLFHQRVELGASVFYLRIDNALTPYVDEGTFTPLFPMQNGGVSETTGFESDLSAQVAGGLALSASAGAYHNNFTSPLGTKFQRSFVPDFTASLALDYQRPVAAGVTGIAGLAWRHHSGGIIPVADGELDDYNLLDLRAGLRWRNTELTAYVRNALDEHNTVTAGPGVIQAVVLAGNGVDPDSVAVRTRDPGAVYGVRATLAF